MNFTILQGMSILLVLVTNTLRTLRANTHTLTHTQKHTHTQTHTNHNPFLLRVHDFSENCTPTILVGSESSTNIYLCVCYSITLFPRLIDNTFKTNKDRHLKLGALKRILFRSRRQILEVPK